MNPEFKRNCWLQVSPARLITIPVVSAILLGIYIASQERPYDMDFIGYSIMVFGIVLFCLVTGILGSSSVAHSVLGEVQEGTWNQQRMSALSPWTMTWGKLFGAPILLWYGGMFCLALICVAQLCIADAMTAGRVIIFIALLVGSVILLHALALVIALHSLLHAGGSSARRIVLPLAVLYGINVLAAKSFFNAWDNTVIWYGREWGAEGFLLTTIVFFAVCTVFAAWRLMNTALQVRTLPWAWLSFALLLSIWLTGFSDEVSALAFSYRAFVVSIVMTYAALLSEDNGIVAWRRVVARAKTAQWRAMLEELPLWPVTLALLVVAAGAILAVHTLTAASYPIEGEISFMFAKYPYTAVIISSLWIVRDVAIILFFSFAVRPRYALPKALGTIILLHVVAGILIGRLTTWSGLRDGEFVSVIIMIAVISTTVIPAIIAVSGVIARWSGYRLRPAG